MRSRGVASDAHVRGHGLSGEPFFGVGEPAAPDGFWRGGGLYLSVPSSTEPCGIMPVGAGAVFAPDGAGGFVAWLAAAAPDGATGAPDGAVASPDGAAVAPDADSPDGVAPAPEAAPLAAGIADVVGVAPGATVVVVSFFSSHQPSANSTKITKVDRIIAREYCNPSPPSTAALLYSSAPHAHANK